MTIKPSELWPTQTDASDANYPNGKAQQDATPETADGTPLHKDWLNDIWGFVAATLFRAGITPSGIPDHKTMSQMLEALRSMFGVQFTFFELDGEHSWTRQSWTLWVRIMGCGGGGGTGGGDQPGWEGVPCAGAGSGYPFFFEGKADAIGDGATIIVGDGGYGGTATEGGGPGGATTVTTDRIMLSGAGGLPGQPGFPDGSMTGGHGFSGGGLPGVDDAGPNALASGGGTGGRDGVTRNGFSGGRGLYGAISGDPHSAKRMMGCLGGAGGTGSRPGGGGGGGPFAGTILGNPTKAQDAPGAGGKGGIGWGAGAGGAAGGLAGAWGMRGTVIIIESARTPIW